VTVSRAVEAERPSDGTTAAVAEERFSAEEVRQRAVGGAAMDLLRGLGGQFVGFFGTLILARLVTPREFGTVALGATFVIFANFLADGGVGAALIRKADEVERADLRALLAFQLGISSGIALVIGGALSAFGTVGQVTALMVMTIPLKAVRAPAVIVLERQLNYRPLAIVEVAEAICYYGAAIALVVAGWGVWGLASAAVVRALAGTIILLFLTPAARLIPSPSWTRVRAFLGFGFRYQAVGVTGLLRDQGVNGLVAVLAGVPALGVWSIANRILQVPLLLFSSLWRVSFPGMARLVATRESMGETIERVVSVVTVAAGVILVPLVAATPAWVPALLGRQWTDVVPVIPPACLHLMIFAPISVALLGYLWAIGEASAVLRATLIGTPLMIGTIIPLLLWIGVPAVGFGWLAAGVGEATILILSARKHVEFSLIDGLLPPTVVGIGAAAAGWFVSSTVGATIVGGLSGGLVAVAAYLAALWVWHRSSLLDSVHLSVRGMRHALGRSG
jgi:O-antigen/teichoic acid export membrane protein